LAATAGAGVTSFIQLVRLDKNNKAKAILKIGFFIYKLVFPLYCKQETKLSIYLINNTLLLFQVHQ
jgi:hypothetical protein